MSNWEEGSVELAAGRIAYHRTGGDLPAVVLAHGLTDNGLCWSRVAAELAPGFDLVMLDAAGHGNSYRVDPGSPPDGAADIAGVIAALELSRPVLLGHSVGARSMAECARRWPDLASCLVLDDPPLVKPQDPERRATQEAAFADYVQDLGSKSDDDLLAMGRQNHPTWTTADLAPWVVAKRQLDGNAMVANRFGEWQASLAGITVPTLLIHGDKSLGSMAVRGVDEARALNPVITAAHIGSAGHNIRREQFAPYMQVLGEFLTANQ